MALSKITQDHDEIRQWAEKRGAVPAEVSSTHSKNEPGILRFCFPKAPNHNNASLHELSWDEFFEKFDENGLELVYQDVTAEGAESNFNKLIYPTDENHSSRHGKSSSSQSSTSHSSPKSAAQSKSSDSHSSKSSDSQSSKSSGSTSRSKASGSHDSKSHSTSGSQSSGGRSTESHAAHSSGSQGSRSSGASRSSGGSKSPGSKTTGSKGSHKAA